MTAIIIKRYEHFNRSLGKYISSKRQYDNEMAKGGYIPFEEAKVIAENVRAKNVKEYKGLSKKAEDIVRSAKLMKDSKGKIMAGNRLREAMQEVGVQTKVPDWCPKHYSKGSFAKEGGYAST